MKRDEKMPMFPRLHVNEREKGGPKAPPRNKMALYEQLSIPSQRFNNNTNITSSTASSTQGTEEKGPVILPLRLRCSTHSADNPNAAVSNLNTSLAACQKNLDEEDFTVPIFVEPENGQNLKNSGGLDQENTSLSRPAHIIRSSRNQSTHNKKQKLNSAAISNLRQKDRCQTEKPQCPPEYKEHREHLTNNVDGLENTNYASNHEIIDGPQLKNVSNRGYKKYKTGYPLEIRNGDKCDEDSETSILDCVSGVNISLDDVVGLIGQKYFWKARSAILNQQRVFAVQVFELHRLIKVQKLFAGSPNLLLGDSAYLGKALKASIPKEPSLEFLIKPSENIKKLKEDQLKNPTEKAESFSENTVRKSSLSSLQNISHHHHPSKEVPISSNPQPTYVISDPKISPWNLNQPTGHHWLVPFMSPTEGLIYKPYPGPAHARSNPMFSNFSNPYGHCNAYFPPYAMPPMCSSISAVDQGNHFLQTRYNEQQKKNSMPNISSFVNTDMDKESTVQVSTASSPVEGGNGLRLFPTSPADDVATENQARVIKVVPHNAVSANESAFRIFQSIQKEREQYEYV